MPEIVEVRKYSDYIKKYLLNKSLIKIDIISGRYKKHGTFPKYDNLSLPAFFNSINTKGKFMYIGFITSTNEQIYLGFTLGLTGGYNVKYKNTIINDNNIYYSTNVYNNVNFIFTDDYTLCMFDQLSFGTIKVFNEDELQKKLSTIGADLFTITEQEFIAALTSKLKKNKSKKNDLIGNLLLNQKIISGIGNYLRADCLYMARISPFTKVADLQDIQIKKIYKNIRKLIYSLYDYNLGVKLQIINPNKDKFPSDYNREFFIYNYKTDINGNVVKKEKLYEGSQVRYIYWCPDIQK
jgi:formamidopyrimidine-DNA glycosylase